MRNGGCRKGRERAWMIGWSREQSSLEEVLWCFGAVFFWEGVGYGTKIDRRMDADIFVSILEDELQQSLEYYNKKPEDILFQKNNEPKHKNKKAQKWLQESGLQLME